VGPSINISPQSKGPLLLTTKGGGVGGGPKLPPNGGPNQGLPKGGRADRTKAPGWDAGGPGTILAAEGLPPTLLGPQGGWWGHSAPRAGGATLTTLPKEKEEAVGASGVERLTHPNPAKLTLMTIPSTKTEGAGGVPNRRQTQGGRRPPMPFMTSAEWAYTHCGQAPRRSWVGDPASPTPLSRADRQSQRWDGGGLPGSICRRSTASRRCGRAPPDPTKDLAITSPGGRGGHKTRAWDPTLPSKS
jgi:hypothetical protein